MIEAVIINDKLRYVRIPKTEFKRYERYFESLFIDRKNIFRICQICKGYEKEKSYLSEYVKIAKEINFLPDNEKLFFIVNESFHQSNITNIKESNEDECISC